MAKDVIITPLSGLVDFQSSSTSQATIELDDNNNLKISGSGGTVQIGNASSDVYIGTGAATVDIIFQQDGSVRGTGTETICLGMSGDNIILPAGVDFAIGTTSFAQNATTTHMGNMSFGIPGNGTNTCARFLSIEGNTDASGEGSGRIFFTEHNSTTTSMSKYGMSIGYRGGGTSVTGADGNVWGGLGQIGNGQWGMWGHDNSVDGSLIMYGDRGATFVCFNNNTVRTSSYVYAGQFIDNDNNSCLVNPSATSYLNALCVNAGLTVDGTTYLSENYNRICLGNSNNTSTAECVGLYLHQSSYTNGQYTHRLRKYDHGGGVPLYIDGSGGTANVFTALTRFGTYTGNSNTFEVFGNAGVTGQLCITSATTSCGNIKFSAANPYICAPSYIVMPGGLYVSGGTAYFSNATMHRGGVCRDNATYLQISGGTGCDTYFPGQVGIGTTDPIHPLHIESGSVFIGEAAYCVTPCANANGKLLNFDNSYDSSAVTPANKIRMHNASTWLGGFGICSSTVTYHSGGCHRWYTASCPSSYGTVAMTLDSTNLIVTSCLAVGGGNSGYLRDVTGDYGSIEVDGGATGGWEGYSIGGRAVFMHDNNVGTGIYNDVNNEWLFYANHNAETRMYYNGISRLCTTDTGAYINQGSSGNYGLAINGSSAGKLVMSGATDPYIRFQEGTTDKAYIQWNGSAGTLYLWNQEDSTALSINNNLCFSADNGTSWCKVWNESIICPTKTMRPYLTNTTTACLMAQIQSCGLFTDTYASAFKSPWDYAGNADLTDAGRLTELAGTSWLTWTDNCTSATRGNITALVIAPNTGGSANKVFIYNDQGSTYAPGWREVWTNASDGSGSGLDADLLDGQQGSYYSCANNLTGTYPDLFSNSTRYNIGLIDGSGAGGRDKLRVWSNAAYTIGMCYPWTYGALNNDYAMTFQMNNDNDRGFWWGDEGHTSAQGAMSLTTHGYLTVASRIKVGGGESDTTGPSYPLHVTGTAYIEGSIYGSNNIYHVGDTDTYMGFHGSNLWRVVTGGTERVEANSTEFNVNDPGGATDFRVEACSTSTGPLGNKAYAIFVDASAGAVGIGTSQPSYALEVNGTAFVTGTFSAGTKNFLIDHPTKENYMLRHGSLEGPENAVYVRGTTTSSSIELPEYWTGLVDEDTITATLTPRGKYLQLFLDRVEDNEIHVGGTEIGELYDYVIYGTRKDVEDLIVEFERPVGS